MSSSLIPERPLLISPTLAATIGLEEAVMFHVLSELMQHTSVPGSTSQQWLEVTQKMLNEVMPFWTQTDIERIQQNLLEKGLIHVDKTSSKPGVLKIAIHQADTRKHSKPVSAKPANKPVNPLYQTPSTGRASQIPDDWHPSEDLYLILSKRNISRSFITDRIKIFVISQQERKKTQYSWHNIFYKYILKEWESSRSYQGLKELEANMSADWQPSEDAYSILEHAGINLSFMEDAVPEFVLYWRETGLKTSTWNTKFIAHVRRQWAKFEVAVEYDVSPKLLPADYQPSQEVYEVLAMANIESKFAQDLVGEFVLYWSERKEISASWHTKFLQHVKYKWANRKSDKGNILEKLTDRSWAN